MIDQLCKAVPTALAIAVTITVSVLATVPQNTHGLCAAVVGGTQSSCNIPGPASFPCGEAGLCAMTFPNYCGYPQPPNGLACDDFGGACKAIACRLWDKRCIRPW